MAECPAKRRTGLRAELRAARRAEQRPGLRTDRRWVDYWTKCRTAGRTAQRGACLSAALRLAAPALACQGDALELSPLPRLCRRTDPVAQGGRWLHLRPSLVVGVFCLAGHDT